MNNKGKKNKDSAMTHGSDSKADNSKDLNIAFKFAYIQFTRHETGKYVVPLTDIKNLDSDSMKNKDVSHTEYLVRWRPDEGEEDKLSCTSSSSTDDEDEFYPAVILKFGKTIEHINNWLAELERQNKRAPAVNVTKITKLEWPAKARPTTAQQQGRARETQAFQETVSKNDME
jgi:hypothetical protein